MRPSCPGFWLFALLATAVVLGRAAVISPRLLRERDSWGPPVVAVAATPVLLAPWLLPLLTTGSASGLLLEAGRLTVDQVTFAGLLTGRLNDLGAPRWLGVVLGVLAFAALIPRRTRVPVVICWLVALAAALVSGVLSHLTLDLPSVTTRPSLGLFVVILQGTRSSPSCSAPTPTSAASTSTTPGGSAAWRPPWPSSPPLVPVGGLGWWLTTPDNALARDAESRARSTCSRARCSARSTACWCSAARSRTASPTGSAATTARPSARTRSSPWPTRTPSSPPRSGRWCPRRRPAWSPRSAPAASSTSCSTSPADGRVSALLDATAGLDQASAEDRSTRAWHVDRPLDASAVEGPGSWWRTALLVVQGLAILAALVLAAPDGAAAQGGAADG